MTGFGLAVSMFSVLPGRAGPAALDRRSTGAVLRWLPVLGLMLGGLSGATASLLSYRLPGATLLCAVIAVAALAGLSGGLHLDGLADTADGLASRAGAERALEIMRRSDIGPFGVVALILTLLVDVAALACLPGNHWRFVAAMAVAAATGRLAATLAGLPGVPPAREAGFGALVTGTVSRAVAAPVAVSVLAISGVLGALTTGHAAHGAVGWPAAVAVALALGWTLRVRLTRALGGITGDVFGALIEVTTTLTLLGLALVR